MSKTLTAAAAGELPPEYERWLDAVKQRIAQTQTRAAVAANRELVLLYWELGRDILSRQERQGWGAKVVDRLAQDLRSAFPQMTGFSVRNLKYMRAFAVAWPDSEFVQQVAAQIPWGHNQVLLDRILEQKVRRWYAQAAIQHGWSRNVLVHHIEGRLIERQGAAVTNFAVTLPQPQSELAQQLIRDPQIFDFLQLGPEFKERELEDALVAEIQKFLLELGRGFAFMGRQYHLAVGGQDYYIDLLFYNTRLHCYVVVELKVDDFKPEYVGKVQFYLAAIDDQLKTPIDGPSIGLILCKTKNSVIAEYALRDAKKPMGVAEYRLALPPKLASVLPSVNDIVVQLNGVSVRVEGHAPTVKVSELTEKAVAKLEVKAAPRKQTGKKVLGKKAPASKRKKAT
jgi:predicted nuclease of restriction endonuclease-like (RecB) superfamily